MRSKLHRLCSAHVWGIATMALLASTTDLALPHLGERAAAAADRAAASQLVEAANVVHSPTLVRNESPLAPMDSAASTDVFVQDCNAAPGFFHATFGSPDVEAVADAADPLQGALLTRIHTVGQRLGVDPYLGEGIAWTESRFDPSARSADGLSIGAFQLTETTAAEMRQRLQGASLDLPLNDEVTLGIGYLRYLRRLFARATVLDDAGNTTTAVPQCAERWRFAIAAYNAGEGRVAESQRRAAAAGRDPTRFGDVRPYLPRITRRYVDSVVTFAVSRLGVPTSAS